MEVRCERCRAQYVFADDQVGEHGLTVRCSNCGHLFKVKKKALVVTLPVGPEEGGAGAVSAADAHRAAAVQAAAQAVFAEAERREWTLRQPSGQTYTFKDMSTLHRWIVERKAHREDEICRSGEPWRRLGSIAELQSFFAVVEAAERASQAPVPPPSQSTAVQFPAAAAPARVEQPSPLSAAARTEFFSAPPAPAAPAAPRTEFFAPPPPAAPRTEFFVPPPPPAAPAAAAPRTELFAPPPPPAPPPPAPPSSRLDGIFTPEPIPLAGTAGGAAAPAASASGTEQGFPPPPPPPPAPARAPGAAWEGQRTAPARATAREPAWTSADQQTGGTMVEGGVLAPKRRGAGPILGVILGTGLVVGAAGWWFFLRQPEPAPRPVVAAVPTPAPTLPPPAAPFVPPAPAKAPEPAPAVAQVAPVPGQPAGPTPAASPEPAKAEPVKAEPAKAEPAKPGEPAPAVAKGGPAPAAEPPPPARAEPAKAAEPAPEKPAEPPPPKAVAAKKPPPAKAAPRTAKSLIAEARKLRERGKTSQALDLYGRAVELQPENADALAGRGWCYLELSQYGPAEASFGAALEADPEGADALLGLAETYRYEGKRGEAVKYYERYLAAHPQGEDAVAAKNAIQQLKE